MFSCEFCKISKNIFSYRTLLVAASKDVMINREMKIAAPVLQPWLQLLITKKNEKNFLSWLFVDILLGLFVSSSEAVVRKVFLEISQNSQKNLPVPESEADEILKFKVLKYFFYWFYTDEI